MDRFTDLLARARGSGQPEATVTLLREALGLWRGDRPYADVTEELVSGGGHPDPRAPDGGA